MISFIGGSFSLVDSVGVSDTPEDAFRPGADRPNWRPTDVPPPEDPRPDAAPDGPPPDAPRDLVPPPEAPLLLLSSS